MALSQSGRSAIFGLIKSMTEMQLTDGLSGALQGFMLPALMNYAKITPSRAVSDRCMSKNCERR